MKLTVHGIEIDFEIRGEGAPLLLIHGWSADRHYMIADLEPVFERHPSWQRIYLDLPGHGRTPAPEWLSTQAQMVEILQQFVTTVCPDLPLAVAGSSYGGYLTLALIRTMPARLRGAALLIPDVPDRNGVRELPGPVDLGGDGEAFGDLDDDEQWIPQALVRPDRRMVDAVRADDVPGYRAADYEFLARLETNYVHNGAAGDPGEPFTEPCLILTGRQDTTVGFRAAGKLLDELPRATYAVVDLAGHHLGRVERPEVFRALVSDWLDRMEAAT